MDEILSRDEAIDLLVKVATAVVQGEQIPYGDSDIIDAIDTIHETNV